MCRMLAFIVLLLVLPAAAIAAAGESHAPSAPNPDLRQGNDSPMGWKLEGGGGRWVDREALEVTGTGDDNSLWRTENLPFEPGRLYEFEFRARRPSGAGSAIAGPTFANRDYHEIGPEWKLYSHVFRAPEGAEGYLRLGQWHATGAIQFDSVAIYPVLAGHSRAGGLVLGEGESVRDGVYQFHGTFGHKGSNDHRVLEESNVGFNSDRWTFGDGGRVTYRFALPGHSFRTGHVRFNVNYHVGGTCTAEVSRNGQSWQTLASADGVESAEAEVPAGLLPAETLLVRLRAGGGSNFQVDQVEFEGRIDPPAPDATGDTIYARQRRVDPEIAIEGLSLERSGGQAMLEASVRNTTGKVLEVSGAIRLAEAGRDRGSQSTSTIPAGQSARVRIPLPAAAPGEHRVEFTLGRAGQATGLAALEFELAVPDFYRTDYGQRIAGAPSGMGVWWCDAAHKVPKQRALPQSEGPAARLAAARHDYEAAQVIVRPENALKGLTAKAGPLVGANGATIAAENIEILRVYYHFVQHPTDRTGVRDWWPDALPPLADPIDVPAGENQPLWVLVYVPRDARPGDYKGEITLEAEGFSTKVPLALHVWDFVLPERNHMETAFGLSPGMIFRYHNLNTDEDRRKVLDLYWECFSKHRISPYDPVPMDPIRVSFVADANPPRAEVDFSAFDAAMARAVEKYRFTGYRLPIRGMGGGTFHERVEPSIGEYGASTPQYQAMFASYLKQLEEYFRQRGWLDMPYIYWFDEPEPKDYDFVRQGFERLKRHAPGLRTMLTEEPVEALAGPVDIWCPVTPNYDHAAAEKRRAAGDRFWWYVCTGPKAPYCTLFIDHPATELRVWHWQTWQRSIVGTLVWESNYWTSSAAFPDTPQNPYEDPMGYVSGYSTPRGVKRFWGNGDGRFIYPPLSAAVPGAAGGPVIEPPVSSIRWEMLREGVEDYEYLYRLRELIAERRGALPAAEAARYESLLKVPETITADMTTFTTDPAPIYGRRAEIARAIEALTERP